jgi:hypothetical protein
VPGDASTLPSGASPNLADLDYTGTVMPPVGSGVPALTIDEKMTIARWIDLGCPINNGDGGATEYGWFLDEIRPTLEVSVPREGRSMDNLTELVIGVADANSGIEPGSLSVVANFALAGRSAGAELADLATPIGDGIYRISLGAPAAVPDDGEIHFEVRDRQGNTTWVTRQRSAAPFTPPPPFACDESPRSGCLQTTDASLSLHLSNETRRALSWKWKSGDPTDIADLGHPMSATSHTLCLYADDGSGPALVADIGVPPGAYWSARGSTGFLYRDRSARADGVTKIKMKAASGGRGSISVKASGAGLPLSAADVPAGAVLTTQLVNSDLQCWEGR